MKLRPELRKFAQTMETVLQANDHKGGWRDEELSWLLDRLKEETKELAWVIKKHEHIQDKNWCESMEPTRGWRGGPDLSPDIAKEAADVAAFAMMIHDIVMHKRK